MNKNQLWGLLLITLLLLPGCNAPKTESASPDAVSPTPGPESDAGGEPLKDESAVELTEAQNGGLVALIVNDTVRIVIDGNPSTGYTWETENLDSSLLEQQGEPAFTSTSNLRGGGGNFVFTFKALKAGVTSLRLIYHRPFEKDTPPERIYEILVDIQE